MFGALALLVTTLAFAIAPFIVWDFNGFAPDLFPVPQYDPPAQPAGWAFRIWGLIYLWLLFLAAFGARFRSRDTNWSQMRSPLILSTALGAAWLPVATNQPLLATGMIAAMLVTAFAALFKSPATDRLTASWAVGLYAGWLSAATCVAVALCLAGYGLLDQASAAQMMIGVAIVLAAGVQLALRRVPTYGLAVIWALSAVYSANASAQPDVAALAMGGIIVLVPLTAFAAIKDLRLA